MKKVLCVLLLLVSFLLSAKSVFASTYNEKIVGGLGYSINLIDSDEIKIENIKTSQPVLTETFLNSVNVVKTYVGSGQTYITEGDDIQSVYEMKYANFENELGIEATKGVLSAGLKTKFGISSNQSSDTHSNSYYYSLESEHVTHSYVIENHKSNTKQFADNLSDEYLNSLSRVNETGDWNWFYNIYGTHLLTGLKLGGKMQFNYSVKSDYINFTSEIKSALSTEINAKVSGVVDGTSKLDIDFGVYDNRSNSKLVKNINMKVIGGQNFSSVSFEDFINNYSPWYNSIKESNSKIIGVFSEGIIPLWDILPQEYSSLKDSMIAAFDNLCDEKYEAYTKLDPKDNPYYIMNPTLIREVSKTINDDGRFQQHIDKVELGKYGINLQSLINQGYLYADVDVKMDHKEVQDGYRNICIFSNSTKDNKYLVSEKEFEIEVDGEAKVTYYTTGSYTFSSFLLSNLDIKSNTIYIRYGAHGTGDDDWLNKNVSISIIFRK